MAENEKQPGDFEGVKSRLEEIANAVGNEDLSLDDALDLFEEAVALGMKVSDLVEEGIFVDADALKENADAPVSRVDESASKDPVSPEQNASEQVNPAPTAARG